MVLEKQLVHSTWNNMNQNLQLHTYGSRMDLIYLKDFPDKIARKQEEFVGTHLVYPIMDGRTIIQMKAHLKGYYSIPATHMKSIKELNSSNAQYLLEQQLYMASSQQIFHEMKTMTANAMPTFFLKDLDMDAINNLSKEHLMEYGASDAVGIHIELSKTQKFFVICCPEDFKFHFYKFHEYSRDYIQFSGVLINYKPRKFIMGRYENLEYLKELSAMRMYQS